MIKIPCINLPSDLPTAEAIKSWKQNIHDYEPEFWEFQYEIHRYLKNISNEELAKRHNEIIRNFAIYSNPVRNVIPINSFLSAWYWYRKEHQTRYEAYLRNTIFPKPEIFFSRDSPPATPSGPNSCNILFRYGEKKYMKEFFEEGKIRISPASTYKDGEISDPRTDDELNKQKYFLGENTKITTVDGKVIPTIGDVTSTVSIPEGYYTLCMATEFEPSIFTEFNYDSCVIIKDPDEFANRLEIASKQKLQGWYYHHNPVEYFDPYEHGKNHYFEATMCKDFRFAYQLEYRFIWDPLNKFTAKDFIFLDIGPLEKIAELYHL